MCALTCSRVGMGVWKWERMIQDQNNTGDSVNGQIISPEGRAQPQTIPSTTRSDQMELCLVQG